MFFSLVLFWREIIQNDEHCYVDEFEIAMSRCNFDLFIRVARGDDGWTRFYSMDDQKDMNSFVAVRTQSDKA